MKKATQILGLLAVGALASACGTLEVPAKSKDCMAECDRNYSVTNIEYQRCVATCSKSNVENDVNVESSSVDRPSSFRTF